MNRNSYERLSQNLRRINKEKGLLKTENRLEFFMLKVLSSNLNRIIR